MYVNTCIISGNLGRDAELRQGASGPLLKFSIANTRPSRGRGDEKTTWVNCTVFGKRGEGLAPHLVKGTKLLVTGEMYLNEYVDKNGTTQKTLDMNVRDVEFVPSPRPNGEGGGSSRATVPAESFDDADDAPF